MRSGKASGKFRGLRERLLEKHCFDCHDDETSEAGLNLLDLGKVDETNAEVWKSVWAQVSLGEMPPKKKAQPSIVDRLRFSDWVISELSREMKDKGGFHAHKDPNKGNFLNHDLLFGPLPEEFGAAHLFSGPYLAGHAAGTYHAVERFDQLGTCL